MATHNTHERSLALTLVSGAWFVKPDFLDSSAEAGCFVDPAPFEVFGDKFEMKGDSKQLHMNVMRTWRLKREKQEAPFAGGSFVPSLPSCLSLVSCPASCSVSDSISQAALHMGHICPLALISAGRLTTVHAGWVVGSMGDHKIMKRETFTRLVELGGGKVLQLDSDNMSIEGLTILVLGENKELSHMVASELIKLRIPCVHDRFICDYIFMRKEFSDSFRPEYSHFPY